MRNYQTEADAVRNLQTYLRQLSYHDPDISPPPVNGIFDPLTRQSLSQFQKKAGLPVSGTANGETWKTLYRAFLKSLAENALPEKVSLFPTTPKGYCLSPGCTGFCVSALQMMLGELQRFLPEEYPIEPTGVYDQATEQNVRIFQSCCPELKETGKVDFATWNAIAVRYNAMFEKPSEE
ncbi:MAG: hypothetical protein E7680_02205 [Ruminococcaceae bacterium]|nr:hypothetical protein [Oscillospiraceae bacterium]